MTVYRSLPLIQVNSVHTFASCFSKMLPSVLRSPNYSRPLKLSNKNFMCISHVSHVLYMLCADSFLTAIMLECVKFGISNFIRNTILWLGA